MTQTGGLQYEIRQSKPFHSVHEEALLGIVRTADVLKRFVSQAVGGGSITAQQYNVLRILRGAGEPGLPTLAIAERMVEQAPGITRLLDRLEAKKLIRRERCREDRRQVICHIAPKGLKVLEELDAPAQQVVQQVMSALTREELRSLVALLDRIRSSNAA